MITIEVLKLEEVIAKLQDKNLKKVAKSANVSYGTVRAIYRGEQNNPTLETMVKLTTYFNA